MSLKWGTGVLLAAVLISATALGGYLWTSAENFPYGRSSADLQIQLKEQVSSVEKRSVYIVKAGDIEGEAVLTSAPTRDVGQSIANSQMVSVKSTFKNSRAPYAGHITSLIDCKTQKYLSEQIIFFGGTGTELVLAVANGRRIFGSCSVDQIEYASAFWAAYDEQRRQVLTVKLFKPISDLNNVEEAQQEILRVFRKVIGQPGGA